MATKPIISLEQLICNNRICTAETFENCQKRNGQCKTCRELAQSIHKAGFYQIPDLKAVHYELSFADGLIVGISIGLPSHYKDIMSKANSAIRRAVEGLPELPEDGK